MRRRIVIVGGGISGLALLHYLKQNCGHEEIVLLEKNDHLGGTIRSLKKQGCLFETGPNGFLDSKPRTLALIKELGLESSLIRADESSRVRYISLRQTLHPFPTTPQNFCSSRLLNPFEKVRILGEFFVPRATHPEETVYEFGKRRLGERFSQVFLDPMVSGICGGDSRQTNLKAAFPRIYQLEQEYGSLFKAMIKIRKAKKKTQKQSQRAAIGSPTGTLTSLRGGLSEIVEAAGRRYEADICLQAPVETVFLKDGRYEVHCANGKQYIADQLFLCSPAYGASRMLKNIDQSLCEELEKIRYAPMAVIGLVFSEKYFAKKPRGYGYLIPSLEKKEVLGVLFESDIFPGRCAPGQVLLRVMIGGARHPDIIRKSR
ncbi:MAG TPA: protoporphyrinogen oxidase, partial [Candidatus Omnitrophota bacterium]|nr:protoporphyrinogen oxidase [Candidatus Omnitrophota bacterium]